MSYYHVLYSLQEDGNQEDCLFSDLSELELQKSFVSPYRSGKRLIVNNSVIDSKRIIKLRIISTARTMQAELDAIKEADRRNREQQMSDTGPSIIILLPRGYRKTEIADVGTDVTEKFVGGVIDSGTLANVIYNPWVITIAAGIITAVAGALILRWVGLDKH